MPVTPLATAHVALDIDVYPINNEKTQKEGVSRTYKGFDGYAPIALYWGQDGWCIGNEPREGKRVAQFSVTESFMRNGKTYQWRRVIPTGHMCNSPNARRLRRASGC
ncbi:MAG: hypothetical protein LUQ11_16155 [Methylococcaceae bacterium]|nr:hypothetical protein [Methylococcaceae bacterium]